MRIAAPSRRHRPENLLPMINVVFLLLIFFLIAAKLAPPEPFTLTLPQAQAEARAAEASGVFTLFLSAEGALAYLDVTGAPAALAALAAARADYCAASDCAATPPLLDLRADARAPAARLAALLGMLAPLGFAEARLVTAAP
jgi:biopolymer transport protein ExbD